LIDSCLPRSRMVVLISYGCMGRSARQDSTASANGLLTFRRGMAPPRVRLLDLEYQSQSTRCQEVSPRTAGGPEKRARWRPWRRSGPGVAGAPVGGAGAACSPSRSGAVCDAAPPDGAGPWAAEADV